MAIFKLHRRVSVTLIMIAFLGACTAASGPVSTGQQVSSEPIPGKFIWHDLITDDIDGAQSFYGDLFGWKFENAKRPGSDEPYVLIRSSGVVFAGMVELADPEGPVDYSRWLGYLSVMDVDASTEKTQSAGGRIVLNPGELGEVARISVVQDPQGAVLGLINSHVGDPADEQQIIQGRVVWNELLAADRVEASDFYSSLKVFESETISRRGGEYTMLNSAGKNRAGILQRPSPEITPLWLTYFAVADPMEAAKRAEQLGGRILKAPSDDFREGTVALVTDPTGAVIALQQWPL